MSLLNLLICISLASPDVTSSSVQFAEGPDGLEFNEEIVEGALEAQLWSFDGGERVLTWTEELAAGPVDRYRLQLRKDGEFSRTRDARGTLHLRRGNFDPLTRQLPKLEGLDANGNLHIVQFQTQAIEAYRSELEALGATVRHYLPESAHIVEMNERVAATVAELPFVRWVGPYAAAERLEEKLRAGILLGDLEPLRVHIQVMERGPKMKQQVAQRITALGGEVVWSIDEGFVFDAVLGAGQMAQVAAFDEVLWIEAWTPFEEDMTRVRVDGGANFIENTVGYTGQGVRGEVMDGDCEETHPDLQSNPVLFHGNNAGSASHGTPCTGVVFGDGAGNASRRGMMPNAQPIFGDYHQVNNRYTHTAELVQSPYNAVFQSNSWGSARTTQYTTQSMQMDDLLFLNDIVLLQSQSNAGNQHSRPEAWAKNVVSIGGIRHNNTQTLADDEWDFAGSTGPAADGRLKPDLCHWYDNILTTSSNGGDSNFGGTSAATPIVAGHFGLFFQMWHEGLFGNATSTTVFESRPKATLARAMMINTASPYAFTGVNADLRRTTQGWGRPDLETLYEDRDKIFFVNEDVVLEETESVSYQMTVDPDTPKLAVTMIYMDRPGTTSSSQHRINDLSLSVSAPNGTVTYWGNAGLAAGNASVPGGTSNTLDVVENVFVNNPAAGVWIVQVFADDINQDTHVETPALDADFALVVRGTSTANSAPCDPPSVYCDGNGNSVTSSGADLSWTGTNSVTANDLTLIGSGFPMSTICVVARSPLQGFRTVNDGIICIDHPIIRIEVIQASPIGTLSYAVDASAAAIGGAVLPGETWNYQIWYADGQSSNFSDAIEVPWCD